MGRPVQGNECVSSINQRFSLNFTGGRSSLPVLVPSVFVGIGLALWLDDNQLFSPEGPSDTLTKCALNIVTFVSLPLLVVYHRAIVVPAEIKLPYFDIRHSLHYLLSAEEHEWPLLLYLTTGVVPVQIIRITISALLQQVVVRVLSRSSPHPLSRVSTAKLAVFILLVLINTAIFTPLEVIAVRLMVQWSVGSLETESALTETVIHLRLNQEKYTGVINCAVTIIEEEGFGALYRLWWCVMLGSVATMRNVFSASQLY
ncbi:hypothetical protein BJ138DRAFT_1139318 [Hygrophoropsis aurantiaca]|uniref:Uncharacterized protein n=1 Tax=Hygrophoropsis aurantiaca TaxID=72124 RepID=A0ACB8AT86_9AGAM|nr:hypothetical protein BJ138DRAFT_1139318 [Hygrophoropsis aurantiaca]